MAKAKAPKEKVPVSSEWIAPEKKSDVERVTLSIEFDVIGGLGCEDKQICNTAVDTVEDTIINLLSTNEDENLRRITATLVSRTFL